MKLGAAAIVVLVLMALLFACGATRADTYVPYGANQYRGDLIRATYSVWGIRGPVATFAAQIHQESRWNANARSPVGARGLAQFMPATARWIAGEYSDRLHGFDPYNPQQSLLAQVTYMTHLYKRAKGRTQCDRMWFALRAYNGGESNLWREASLAADPQDRARVDEQCGRARRARRHCRENLEYPRKIIFEHQPHYKAWGPGVKCN